MRSGKAAAAQVEGARRLRICGAGALQRAGRQGGREIPRLRCAALGMTEGRGGARNDREGAGGGYALTEQEALERAAAGVRVSMRSGGTGNEKK